MPQRKPPTTADVQRIIDAYHAPLSESIREHYRDKALYLKDGKLYRAEFDGSKRAFVILP
jgi:hypothetical protein